LGGDPFLDTIPRIDERVLLARSFLVRYRVSKFNKDGQFVARRTIPMVSATVRHTVGSLAAAFRKRGRPSPFHLPTDGPEPGGGLHYRIRDLLQSFENEDPQAKKQKAIPPLFLRDLVEFARDKDQKTRVTADLVIGGFFFAMRACEFC